MRSETLDKILRDLTTIDQMQRLQAAVRSLPPELPEAVLFSSVAEDAPVQRKAIKEEFSSAVAKHAVQYASRALNVAAHYVQQAKQYVATVYEHARDLFYVHVPSWIKVHRASFNEFGASLYGLTTPATGDVHIREDLQGDEFSEVLLHEVAHNLYPNFSERQIRAHVRSILGVRAVIHSRLG